MKVLETLELIRWLVLDVDGTMTDGGIYLDGNGIETKKFTVQDLSLIHICGERLYPLREDAGSGRVGQDDPVEPGSVPGGDVDLPGEPEQDRAEAIMTGAQKGKRR